MSFRITMLVAVGFAWSAGLSVSHAGTILFNQPPQFPGLFNAAVSQNQASGAQYQTFDDFSLAGGGTIVLAQRKQEFRRDGVGERDGKTSCQEVAASCREGLTPWCQSRR